MTKADYVHLFKEACGGRCNAEYNPCAFRRAADSLAALEPVAFIREDGKLLTYKNVAMPKNIAVYSLDEANNEPA